MKHLKILLLCVCLLLSAGYSIKSQENKSSNGQAKTENIKFVNPFRPIGKLFSKIFNRKQPFVCDLPASVVALYLNKTEIPTICQTDDKDCLTNSRSIQIATVATDPENGVLKYLYTVTGGKIIGQGANVVWDLSETKPGIYTITAAVDDGRGFWGTTQTQAITVK